MSALHGYMGGRNVASSAASIRHCIDVMCGMDGGGGWKGGAGAGAGSAREHGAKPSNIQQELRMCPG